MPLNLENKIGLANRFYLSIIPADYDFGSWTKADGLDVAWDVAEYRAGDNGNDRWFLPGNTKYTNVKLSRAACEDSAKVKKWLGDTSFGHKTDMSAKLFLYDSKGEEVLHWDFWNILPVKWSIGGFDAGASKVQVETLEFAHMGFIPDPIKIGTVASGGNRAG
jgi:phage tail-like protein